MPVDTPAAASVRTLINRPICPGAAASVAPDAEAAYTTQPPAGSDSSASCRQLQFSVFFNLKYFWCRTWAFVVACVHTHGVSTHTSYTVLYQAKDHSFRYSSGRTLLTVRFLSVAKGGNCAQTEANPISRGRQSEDCSETSSKAVSSGHVTRPKNLFRGGSSSVTCRQL